MGLRLTSVYAKIICVAVSNSQQNIKCVDEKSRNPLLNEFMFMWSRSGLHAIPFRSLQRSCRDRRIIPIKLNIDFIRKTSEINGTE